MSEQLLAVIQARMGSTRLPGKSTLNLGGIPLIEWVIQRVLQLLPKERIVIATSNQKDNRLISETASRFQVGCFFGSEEDVLSRFLEIQKEFTFCDQIYRICADNPFTSPDVMSKMYQVAKGHRFDLITSVENFREPIYIDGLGTELMSKNAIEFLDENQNQLDLYDREHVTSFFYRNHERFKILEVNLEDYYQAPDLRLDVDTKADYERLCMMVNKFKLSPYSTDREIIDAAKAIVKD